MKILTIAAILFLTSCNKVIDYVGTHDTKLDETLTKPVEVELTLTNATHNYRFTSETYSNVGDIWSNTDSLGNAYPLEAATVKDTVVYRIQAESQENAEFLGAAEFKLIRNPAALVGNEYHGDGIWYLIRATGVYSFMKFAKGTFTFVETHDSENESYYEYVLKGKSN